MKKLIFFVRQHPAKATILVTLKLRHCNYPLCLSIYYLNEYLLLNLLLFLVFFYYIFLFFYFIYIFFIYLILSIIYLLYYS